MTNIRLPDHRNLRSSRHFLLPGSAERPLHRFIVCHTGLTFFKQGSSQKNRFRETEPSRVFHLKKCPVQHLGTQRKIVKVPDDPILLSVPIHEQGGPVVGCPDQIL